MERPALRRRMLDQPQIRADQPRWRGTLNPV